MPGPFLFELLLFELLLFELHLAAFGPHLGGGSRRVQDVGYG